jgi:hypothetical protein
MLFRRRGNDPVALPSLDRVSGLIDRVGELVDAVVEGKPAAPARDPAAERSREATEHVEPLPAAAAAAWVAFVSSPHGYRLVDRPGPTPSQGDSVQVDGQALRVVRLGPSPLPGDRRRCAYLAGEEPAEEARTSDA